RRPCPRRARACGRRAGRAGEEERSGEDRPPRRPRESWPAGARAESAESLLRRLASQAVENRVGLAEDARDFLDRHVGIAAADAQVLHVPAVLFIERMEDRVLAAIELERLDAKAPAQLEVEGRGGLDPAAL